MQISVLLIRILSLEHLCINPQWRIKPEELAGEKYLGNLGTPTVNFRVPSKESRVTKVGRKSSLIKRHLSVQKGSICSFLSTAFSKSVSQRPRSFQFFCVSFAVVAGSEENAWEAEGVHRRKGVTQGWA